MKKQTWGVVVIALLAVAILGAASEKKINRKDLPPAVEKTVAEQSSGAVIRGFSTEMENGKRIYEANLTVQGRSKDISIDAEGKIIEIEEEVPIDTLPGSVKSALTEIAGPGKINKVESLTKSGKLVAYEAVIKAGNKRFEIQVSPDGHKLEHPE